MALTNPALRRFRATFLRELATGQVVDAGCAQQREKYIGRVKYQLGGVVRDLHRARIIASAGAGPASRPTRHRTVGHWWIAVDVEICRQLAAQDEQWLLEHDEAPNPVPRRQRNLFDLLEDNADVAASN